MSSGEYWKILLGRQGPPLDLLLPGACALGFLQLEQTTISSWEGQAPQGLGARGTAPARPKVVTEAVEPAVPAQVGLGLSQEVLGAHAGA